jgi:hypothetical protein
METHRHTNHHALIHKLIDSHSHLFMYLILMGLMAAIGRSLTQPGLGTVFGTLPLNTHLGSILFSPLASVSAGESGRPWQRQSSPCKK